MRLSNKRLALGLLTIVVGLVAQFYNKKFPQNKDFLLTCIALYPSTRRSCFIFKMFRFLFFYLCENLFRLKIVLMKKIRHFGFFI